MAVVPIDLAEGRAGLRTAGAATAALVRSAQDPAAPVRTLGWTVAQTATHLRYVGDAFSRTAAGEHLRVEVPDRATVKERIAHLNARTVEGASQANLGVLAEQLERSVGDFLDATEGRAGDVRIPTPWYGEGLALDLDEATAVLLGEHLIHGYDIATAARRPWPIDPRQARVVLAGLTAMMPLYVNAGAARGMRATFDMRVRGGPRFTVRVDDGALAVTPPAPGADCHLSVDPVACLLVAYGRRRQWGPILRGQMLTWGRKPWLALRFKGLILDP